MGKVHSFIHTFLQRFLKVRKSGKTSKTKFEILEFLRIRIGILTNFDTNLKSKKY